jgi:hypothetical protein
MSEAYLLVKQFKDKWCWSAVSVSVDHYFSPESEWTQCKVAKAVQHNSDCCSEPNDCNEGAALSTALHTVKRFKKLQNGPLEFEQIKDEIDGGHPVCCRIAWRAGGAHFVILWGYRELNSGVQQVEVADPFFADSIVSYDQFVTAYGSIDQPGGGEWTHTYLTQR